MFEEDYEGFYECLLLVMIMIKYVELVVDIGVLYSIEVYKII